MTILEIIWILATVLNIWLIREVILAEVAELAVFLIGIEVISIAFLVKHWWDFLTTPLWG